MNLKLIFIILTIFIILLIFLRNSYRENFQMPGHKDNLQQPEISTNLSNFKEIDKAAFSMILDLKAYKYDINTNVCYGPTKCDKYTTSTFGFNPEEVKKYEIKNLVRNNKVSNEDMVPFVVESIKQALKNLETQNKTIKEIEEKLVQLEKK